METTEAAEKRQHRRGCRAGKAKAESKAGDARFLQWVQCKPKPLAPELFHIIRREKELVAAIQQRQTILDPKEREEQDRHINYLRARNLEDRPLLTVLAREGKVPNPYGSGK